MSKWKRTKGQNQQPDLKTEYPYDSCLPVHEVTFIKSPFECSTVTATLYTNKILLNNYLNFTLQSLHYYYFNKSKKLKIRNYQEFSHEIQEKIKNCSKSGKIRNNQEVLDRLRYVIRILSIPVW